MDSYSSGYGYSSQGAARGGVAPSRGIASVGHYSQQTGGGGGYSSHQQQQPASSHGGYSQQHGSGIASYPSSVSPVAGISKADRSAQINEYVAKQKAAKQNAPQIRKENQRLAEARSASASRSKASESSSHHDDYADDHSNGYHGGGGFDDAPLPTHGRNSAPTTGTQRPAANARPAASSGYGAEAAPVRRQSSNSAGSQQQQQQPTKSVRYDDGYAPSATISHIPSAGIAAGGSGGGGGGNTAALEKRVVMLEDQIKLLKQQNRIFLSFMQNTEQQLAELRSGQAAAAQPVAAPVASSRGRPGAAAAAENGGGQAAAAYPNNMSSNTKQVLQRSQSERQTQSGIPAPSRQASMQQQQAGGNSPQVGALGGRMDVDQSFAPLEEDEAARRERLRSAKKKAELQKLRSKMKPPGGAQAQQQQQQQQDEHDTRGRGYEADAYADDGYGGGSGGGYGAPQQQANPRASAGPQRVSSASSRRPVAAAAPPPSEYPDEYANDSFGGGGGGAVPEGADVVQETFPCPNCERRFNAQALQKHVAKQICKQKPRKVFNMAAQRLEELAKEAREAGIQLPIKKPVAPAAGGGGGGGAGGGKGGAAAAGGAEGALPVKKQSKWRADHEKLMAGIRAGRSMKAAIDAGVPLSSLPPPPAAREEDDDRTPCPHCGRKFDSGVAERHIPHCKNTKNKPKATAQSAARLGSTVRR